MSNKESSSSSGSSKDDQAPDLSALDFGPAWARKDTGGKPKRASGKAPGNEPRHKGGGRKPDGRGGDRKRGSKRRPHNKSNFHGRGDAKPSTSPAEGVSARIMPIEEGMDNMAKEISATGRTHSVFDLAWLVLGGLERFHVIFENEQDLLYQSKKDRSVWLTKSECLRHFWSAKLADKYYSEEVTEGEAPAGNFQSVARCGLSGKLIGPPNHHSYQQAVLDLHRERASNMPLDKYKNKIVMEHGEEVVEKWVEQVKKQSVWRPKPQPSGEEEEVAHVEKEAEQQSNETLDAENVDEPTAEVVVDDAAEKVSDEPVAEEKPKVQPIDETVPVFKSRREVEQHFLAHGFDDAFYQSKTVAVPANISHKMISPGLMATLRHVVTEEKRYPGNLASFLCRQMSGRHLAVFKWKKRLHCGPARPKYVPDDLVMADRPSKLFHWVLDHPSGNLEEMWKDCLPEKVDDETRHTWYHDLHWLINEGLVLLFSDGTLHAAKEQKRPPVEQPKAVQDTAVQDKDSGGEEGKEEQADAPPDAPATDDS